MVVGNGEKISLFLTEGRTIVRQGIALMLGREPDIEIVGETGDGWLSIEGVQALRPDVVLMGMSLSSEKVSVIVQ